MKESKYKKELCEYQPLMLQLSLMEIKENLPLQFFSSFKYHVPNPQLAIPNSGMRTLISKPYLKYALRTGCNDLNIMEKN